MIRAGKEAAMFWRRWKWWKRWDTKSKLTILQSIVTILAFGFGAFWAVWTWWRQSEEKTAREVPALEVRVFAEEAILTDENKACLLVSRMPDMRFIRGVVTLKNVGTSQTNLHLCECGMMSDATPEICEINETDGTPKCKGKNSIPQGPIVVSSVFSMKNPLMQFEKGDLKRFWLVSPSVEYRRPDKILEDEMRPQAKDKFEFLVTVPHPGLYAVMFTSPVDEDEFGRMKKNMKKKWERPYWPRWDATTFVEVGSDKTSAKCKISQVYPR
ncbi:MAG TPA: hypothetical protein VHA33_22170 [Candidatus Angelobacter sp.]|nr:hypothetical protein [Candidatus Angelobacter sp.]